MSRTDKTAFESLIEPHFDRLFRLAYRLTGNRPDAEDLIQDLLIKLYQRRAELSSIEELSPWLGRVLYNQFIDGVRRYGRQPLQLVDPATLEVESASADPAADATRGERLNAISKAIDRLSEEHRVMLLMHDAEGYTLTEIETLTGIALGTCKSRLHRARARLRELLDPTGKAPAADQAAEPGLESPGHEKKVEPFSRAGRVGG